MITAIMVTTFLSIWVKSNVTLYIRIEDNRMCSFDLVGYLPSKLEVAWEKLTREYHPWKIPLTHILMVINGSVENGDHPHQPSPDHKSAVRAGHDLEILLAPVSGHHLLIKSLKYISSIISLEYHLPPWIHFWLATGFFSPTLEINDHSWLRGQAQK